MATAFTPLTQAQAVDPLWRRAIKPQLALRLEELRAQLESPSTPPDSTASLRGRIALLKELLALETDRAAQARRQAAESNDE